MIDRLQRFPNQNIIQRQNECVLETVCDIWGNIQDQPFAPDFNLAATFKVMGVPPSSGGTDPYAGMLSALVYGALPTEVEPTDVSTGSELLAANWANYDPNMKRLALHYAATGIKQLYSYQDICNYLDTQQRGVAFAMKWFESFMVPLQDGSLPQPRDNFSDHCVAIFGYDEQGLKAKAWLGPDFGDKGYCYIPEVMFNLVFVEAFAFVDQWRWLNLARTGLSHPWLLPDIIPQLSPSTS